MPFVAEITTAGNGSKHGRPTIRDIASLAGVSPATVSSEDKEKVNTKGC